MKARLIGLMIGLVVGATFSFLCNDVVKAHEADAFDTETYWDGRYLGSWSRSQAYNFAITVIGEPYSTLGGWWIHNYYEDPVDPTKGAEGTDCSGLLFKSWMLVHQQGVTGYKLWYADDDTHGPYQAHHFYNYSNGCANVCTKLCDGGGSCGSYGLSRLDAFVSSDHVATYDAKDASGYDIIIEAADPWYFRHTNFYRNSTDYIGIERYNW
jgi:hypothetical protein